MKNGNGIRLYFVIGNDHVADFLDGCVVLAWPTLPEPKYAAKPPLNGGTKIRIDPDRVEVGDYGDGVFSIQMKCAKNRPANKGLGGDPSTSVKAAIRGGPSGIMPKTS